MKSRSGSRVGDSGSIRFLTMIFVRIEIQSFLKFLRIEVSDGSGSSSALGYVLVFPNCHIHKISKLLNTSKTVAASRRVVVFFVVNPDHRILSTREVQNTSLFSAQWKFEHDELPSENHPSSQAKYQIKYREKRIGWIDSQWKMVMLIQRAP